MHDLAWRLAAFALHAGGIGWNFRQQMQQPSSRCDLDLDFDPELSLFELLTLRLR